MDHPYKLHRPDLAPVTDPSPPPEPATGASIEEVLRKCLRPKEPVRHMASALWRSTSDRFEETAILLTDMRLLVVATGEERGFELRSAMERSGCHVLNREDKDDGGTLMLIRHPSGVLCLYFASPWRREAAAMDVELGAPPETTFEERPIAAGETAHRAADVGPVDRFTLVQEFSGLGQPRDEDDY